MSLPLRSLSLSLGLCLMAGTALATPVTAADAPADGGEHSTWYELSHRDTLLGDAGGVRPWLDNYGITVGVVETSEIFDNLSGGLHRGSDYTGLTTATIQLDTKKAFGWEGGLFNVSGLDIHGSNFSNKKLGNLQTASGIEADNTIRLWELWYQQAFDGGKTDVRIGQQSLDQEFMISSNALLFANTMFGWPMVPSADLPSGGPAYPLSSPGIRVRSQLNDQVTILGGVFNDNPSGISPTSPLDSQRVNHFGTNFRMSDDPIVIAEVQYARGAKAEGHEASAADPLPGTYRLGGWYDFGKFADQGYGTDGLSLGDPGSNGDPRLHRGNYSIYVVADQQVWRPDFKSDGGLSLFTRIMGAPSDRNFIDFSVNAGATYKGLFAGREDDTLGVGYGLANVSSSASTVSQVSGTYPELTYEQFVEVTYQAQITPWWQVQPDFQYIFNPGAGALQLNGVTRLKNEAVIGVRTNISF